MSLPAPTVADLAHAIAREEGYFQLGTRPERNRNPGDLRSPISGRVDPGGFSIFVSDLAGWAALEMDLRAHARTYPDQTLAQFIGGDGKWPGYAPASDGNDPGAYAANVAAMAGIAQATFRMGDLV